MKKKKKFIPSIIIGIILAILLVGHMAWVENRLWNIGKQTDLNQQNITKIVEFINQVTNQNQNR